MLAPRVATLALPALRSGNPRLGKKFLEPGRRRVASDVSREGRWGWDGASLEHVSGFSDDPIGYSGGINLYGYVGDDPLTRTDPLGLAVEPTMGASCTIEIFAGHISFEERWQDYRDFLERMGYHCDWSTGQCVITDSSRQQTEDRAKNDTCYFGLRQREFMGETVC